MKISKVTVYQRDLPLRQPYSLSGGRLRVQALDSTLVRLDTDEGIHGWGEGCPWGHTYLPAFGPGIRAGIAQLSPTILGHDPRQTELLDRAMDLALPGHLYVKSAIDIAAWDILGKATGLPLCDLLGGRWPGPIPVEASVGTGTPEEMSATIDAYRDRGYVAFSAKIGSGIDDDIARIRRLWSLVGSPDALSFDANRAWLPHQAITVMNAVGDIPARFEQPCDTFEACVHVRRLTTPMISLDEFVVTFPDLVRLHAERAVEVVNIKINRVGGLTKARRLRDFCQGVGLPMLVMETGGSILADAAAAHLAQSVRPDYRVATWMPHDMIAVDIAPGQGPRLLNGTVSASELPGLGVEPDPAVLGDPVAVYTPDD